VAVRLFAEGLFDEPGGTKRGENIPKLGSSDIVAFNTRFVDSRPDVLHSVERARQLSLKKELRLTDVLQLLM
jgi:hypothetical protein